MSYVIIVFVFVTLLCMLPAFIKATYAVEMNKENRGSTYGYLRWKVEKRHGKSGQTGQQLENEQVPKGTELGVPKGKRPLMACHTRCQCSIETTSNSMKVKLGIKFMKLVKSLIDWKVTVTGRGSKCHSTFVKGRFAASYCWIRSPYRP